MPLNKGAEFVPTTIAEACEIFDAALNARDFPSWGIAHWCDALANLQTYGILAPCYEQMVVRAPRCISDFSCEWWKAHATKMSMRAQALSEFARLARREHLHFLIVGGMAFAQLLYGDFRARQSGDIDLLVDFDDLSKADYVARECGWLEPGEGFAARQLLNRGELNAEYLRDQHIPYFIRSNAFLPHVTNYFYAHQSGEMETLEIHDRLHGLDAISAHNLLWDVQELEIAEYDYLTVSNEAGFLVSCLSLFESAESVRANTSERSGFGFKTLCDIHAWCHLARVGELNLSVAARLARSLHIENKISVALEDVCGLFTDDRSLLSSHFALLPSPWHFPYAYRVVKPHRRAEHAIALLSERFNEEASRTRLQACRQNFIPSFGLIKQGDEKVIDPSATVNGGQDGAISLRPLASVDGISGTSIQACLQLCNAELNLLWAIPAQLLDRKEDLVLQALLINLEGSDVEFWENSGIIGREKKVHESIEKRQAEFRKTEEPFGSSEQESANAAVRSLGLRLNLFCVQGSWQASVQKMIAGLVDGHANKISTGIELTVNSSVMSDGSLSLKLALPQGAVFSDQQEIPLAIFSAYSTVYGRITRRIAGADLMEIADDLLG